MRSKASNCNSTNSQMGGYFFFSFVDPKKSSMKWCAQIQFEIKRFKNFFRSLVSIFTHIQIISSGNTKLIVEIVDAHSYCIKTKTNWLFPLIFHKSGADVKNDASNTLNEYWNMIFIFIFRSLFNKTKINSTTWYSILMRNKYSLNRSPIIESVITYLNVNVNGNGNCKLTMLRSAII